MKNRRKARDIAFKALYQKEFGQVEEENLEYIFFIENINNPKITEFAGALFRGILENIDEIDNIIKKNIINWEFNRLSLIDKTLLRIGIFEILKLDDIPKKVTINEIVELSKVYSDMDSYKFINGLLDTINGNKKY